MRPWNVFRQINSLFSAVVCSVVISWLLGAAQGSFAQNTAVATDPLPIPIGCSEGKDGLSAYLAGARMNPTSPAHSVLVRRCIRGTTYPGGYDAGMEEKLFLFDPLNNTLYNFGGVRAFQGLQTNALTRLRTRPHFAWDLVVAKGKSAVPPRSGACGIVDPFSRRLVMYGGDNVLAPSPSTMDFNDTWVYPLDVGATDWTQLSIPPPQFPRHQAEAVLDPIGKRMYVYGGGSATGLPVGNQLLALDLEPGKEAWSEVAVSVKPPGNYERIYHGLAYDSRRHRLVLVGGGQAFGIPPGAFGDVWVLPLANPMAGWYHPPYTNLAIDNAFVGTYVFYDAVTDAYFVYQGVSFKDGKKWGKSDAYQHILHFWKIKPNPDDSLTWTKLDTVFPGGYPLQTRVFWDPHGRFGLSMSGINHTTGCLGCDPYYNREIRMYLLGEGG